MKNMELCGIFGAVLVLVAIPVRVGWADEARGASPLVRYGTMREAIGQKQHQGRVQLRELVEQPHFFGVAAQAGLAGEITIYDGKITVTRVNEAGQLEPAPGTLAEIEATMLVGQHVPAWSQHPVTRDVPAAEFDAFIADVAQRAGIKTSTPFLFTIEGEFADVMLHVINGACPIHARLKKQELPAETRAYETELASVPGKLVGIYARDAVGKLTHPATNTHAHLLYADTDSGDWFTGHLEQVAIKAGSVLRLPSSGSE